ncbi:MAG: DUF3237 family protein [Pseudonocardiaceae bacterium]|nr:MAG: DUF3237 family protein [Pseudonocardiaceae bacterium]
MKRLSASRVASGDWVTVGPQGVATLDIRSAYRTDDGATIYVQASGRCDCRPGWSSP